MLTCYSGGNEVALKVDHPVRVCIYSIHKIRQQGTPHKGHAPAVSYSHCFHNVTFCFRLEDIFVHTTVINLVQQLE